MRKTPHRHSFSDGLCCCGQRQSDAAVNPEAAVGRGIEQALLHGLFPDPVLRRTLLRSVGAATVLGALSTLLPLATLKAIAQEKQPLEKTKLNVGFLPITCAAPLIYGEHLGHYAKQGLDVGPAENRRHQSDPRQDDQRRAPTSPSRSCPSP
jgi:nitrate/nitrite transport system substrate-binding protein